jgi:proliferating cell nuclear antigen
MKLVLTDAAYLKDSIAVISELVNEARFKIRRDSIELVAMDPANVAMVVFRLWASAFTEYTIDKEQEIAINLAQLKQILKRASPSDTVTLQVSQSKLLVQFRNAVERNFDLPLIDIEEREQRVPNLTFPVQVTLPSAMLADAIADADICAESVTFAAEPEKFAVLADGDQGRHQTMMSAGESVRVTSEAATKVKAKYSIEYLKKMMSAGKMASDVTVAFNQDYPLKLEYKVMDKVMLSFILAPRVEND